MDLRVFRGLLEELTELIEIPPLPRAAADDQARRIELVGTDDVFVGPPERDQLHLKLRRLGFCLRLGFLALLGPCRLCIRGLGYGRLFLGRLRIGRLRIGRSRLGRRRRWRSGFGGGLRLGSRGLGHGGGTVVGLGQAGSRRQGKQQGHAPGQFQSQSTGQSAVSSLHAFLPARVDYF